ncbi:MAG: EamA family transporter [Geminicoccaceae bacterium]|nr:EamA family transporter [Geminicoccaceae bacterium]MCB9942629.1 EamA family transporter [Geminicoccaceae bacterium]
MSDYAKGLMITTLGVLIITPDALLLRLVNADPWTVLVYRGFGFFLVQALIVIWTHGRHTPGALRATGTDGVIIIGLFAVSQCCFVLSITHTSVANTLVIIATSPLMAAILARFWLKERVERRTLVAGIVSVAAVVLTLSSSLGTGHVAGDMAGLVTMILLATLFTLLRRARNRDMLPAVAMSGLGTMTIALFMADTVTVTSQDWLWLGLLAFFVSPVSFALISTGPRYLPAPEVSLLMLVETALGPLWVWLALGEQPPLRTLIGGALLLMVLTINAIVGMRSRSRKYR